MNRSLPLFIMLLAFAGHACGQILTSNPPFPTQTDNITILFDGDLGNGALAGVFPIFAHTGVISNLSPTPTSWQHTQGNWGTSDPDVAMSIVSIPQNQHSITINPSTFYGLENGEVVSRLMFVFRNSNGSVVGRNADGSDIWLDLYPAGVFSAGFLQPGVTSQIVNANQVVNVQAGSSTASTLTIYVNGNQVATQSNATSLSYNFSSATPGEYVISMLADNGTDEVTDETTVVILPSVNVQAAPGGTVDGITYTSTTSVRLQLYAPNKDYVFVLGAFNNWQYDLDYYMNRTPDGSTYWIDIPGLTAGQEYPFQYVVVKNGEQVRIGDPYADKILDPWNDPWIEETTYPDLIEYPSGLTYEPVSVLQTNQTPFNWSDQSFVRPPKERIVVYELLIRDFLEDRTFNSLIDSLDYLENLGITALQLMPINEFEGNNSWGYNPMYYFAVDKAYGTEEAFKTLVNECHNRGIAVILDIALNHSFGQNPFVKLYFNPDAGQYGQPTSENPWFNQVDKHPFGVGYDFNHESTRTRNFCKRVLEYWLEEYHIDGYRFDLSKGFTQNNTLGNVAAWNAYDQSRVNILNDYHAHIQSVEPGAYLILEHLGDNSEESVLSADGMMLWGKMTQAYEEAVMGFSSNLSGASYQSRGWSDPHLVSYAESHDEERLMYKALNYGNSVSGYDIQELETALHRQELAHCFLIPIPGPHMIWQFGELGYDFSIWTCNDGVTVDIDNTDCRISPKPVRWDYRGDANRLYVYKVVSALNNLKKTQQVFSTTDFDTDLGGFGKRIHLNGSSMDAVVVGNFDVIGINMVPGFQHTGTWYDYFSNTSFSVNDLGASFYYEPGEYHIYTDMPLPAPDLSVNVEEVLTFFGHEFIVYPNPAQDVLNIGFRQNSPGPVSAQLLDLAGRTVATYSAESMGTGPQGFQWNTGNAGLPAGTYVVRVTTGEGIFSQPIVLNP